MADITRKVSRMAAARAAVDGRQARRDGKPVTVCPWNPRGSVLHRFLARYWVMGWNRADRPVAQ